MMKEVTLKEGLNLLVRDGGKLKSDGLSENEYMFYNPQAGICYEDNFVIGITPIRAFNVLMALGWPIGKRFYYVEE